MKLIKITFLLAVVSIIVSLSISQAYATPPSMVVVAELKANHTVKKTQMVTKNTYTEMQYKNNKNFTAITDPCPDCKIGTEVYGDNDNKMGTTITTVMGNTRGLGVSDRGDYKVGVWRVGITAMKTHHAGEWFVNTTP